MSERVQSGDEEDEGRMLEWLAAGHDDVLRASLVDPPEQRRRAHRAIIDSARRAEPGDAAAPVDGGRLGVILRVFLVGGGFLRTGCGPGPLEPDLDNPSEGNTTEESGRTLARERPFCL